MQYIRTCFDDVETLLLKLQILGIKIKQRASGIFAQLYCKPH
jgi:hypothetical protein